MGRFPVAWLILGAVVAPAGARAQQQPTASRPASQPAAAASGPIDLRSLKEEERIRLDAEVKELPSLGRMRFEDIIHFYVEEGDLVVETKLDPTKGRSSVELTGMPGYTTVNVQGPPLNAPAKVAPRQPLEGQRRAPQPQPPQGQPAGAPPPAMALQFEHYDLADPNSVLLHTQIFVLPNHIQVARDSELPGEDRSVSLIQQIRPDRGQVTPEGREPAVKLYVKYINNVSGDTTVDLRLAAENVEELIAKFPRETGEYLRPIFRELGQDRMFAVKPGVAWQVLGKDWTPPPETAAAVEAILPRLNAGSAKDREAAEQELRKLGPPAAVVLMRENRRRFSAEQNARIDAVLAPFRTLSDADVQRDYEGTEFLIDCLLSDDRQVRELALARLRHVRGRDVAFDIDAAPAERGEAAVRLRKQLVPPAATQASQVGKPPGAG